MEEVFKITASNLLILLVNFVSEFRLELMCSSLIVNISSIITHLEAACAAAVVHRKHFFRLYQRNKSSESGY